METITGKWYNKNNMSEKPLNAIDTIIDGDNMYVNTDRGLIDMNEFSNNYIQMSDDLYDEKTHNVVTSSVPTENELKTVQKTTTMITEPLEPISNMNIYDKSYSQPSNDNIKNNKEFLIKKVLKDNMPFLSLSTEWANCPKSGLNTLISFFDITVEDIAKYIEDNITFDKEKLKKFIYKSLDSEYKEDKVVEPIKSTNTNSTRKKSVAKSKKIDCKDFLEVKSKIEKKK